VPQHTPTVAAAIPDSNKKSMLRTAMPPLRSLIAFHDKNTAMP
jgi:hypothetical protein